MAAAKLILNTSNFRKGATTRGGPKWMFSTSIVWQEPGKPPRILATINGCQIGGAFKVHPPGGGTPKTGYWKTVEFCDEWLAALEAQLKDNPLIMEWLNTPPEGKKPKDPGVEGVGFSLEIGQVGS